MRFHVALLAGAIALVAACSSSTAPNRIVLSLTTIDGKALPVTLSTGTGTSTIVAGRLDGTPAGQICNYYISSSTSTDGAFGTLSSCIVNKGDVVSVPLNLGGTPWPSGSHSYRFE
jgi:hypothetical protein